MFIGTPPARRPKRRGDNDDMIDDEFKIRRMNTPEGEALSPTMDDGSDSEPVGLSGTMLDSMDIIDRKILASPILGIDITEVYSTERVAKVARSLDYRLGRQLISPMGGTSAEKTISDWLRARSEKSHHIS